MQFRDLKKQYDYIKEKVDLGINEVIMTSSFVQGKQVEELETELARYVGVSHCITCANGTDALQLALMTWEIGEGDAVFVPDFTFFSSGEVVSTVGAMPIFVDVNEDDFNISIKSLKMAIQKIIEEKKYTPKVIVAVDLFGQPANYPEIRKIADEYNLYILEDGAQGFGGKIGNKRACSFGDISTTSFFPAKPLGCYGDGGAIFTDNDAWAELLRSYRVHGKGSSKYDNVRIGMNSRLDTIQAAILLAKLPIFINEELRNEQRIANMYTAGLKGHVITPTINESFYSSWAQYTIRLKDIEQRNGLQDFLRSKDIPSMIYYQKPMHMQKAFKESAYEMFDYSNTVKLCKTVLSLPFHPYLDDEEVQFVIENVLEYISRC